MNFHSIFIFSAFFLGMNVNLAQAQSVTQDFGISEIRAGIYAHNVYNGFLPTKAERWNDLSNIEDINLQILFTSPDVEFFRWLGSPRPSLGATFNVTGRETIAHLGLTWQAQIFETPFFVEGTFGAGIHNGDLDNAIAPNRNMGCRFGFYEAASIGMNLADNITAMLTYEHISNLELCSKNDGLSNFGIRIGYKF